MAKSADAFRTISEVADWLDTPAHVLRFWESKFSQVKPVKRAGGRRYYRPADMLLLGGIKKLLHEDGMTIKGVQKLLREQGIKHVSSLSQPLDEVTEIEASEIAIDVPSDDTPPVSAEVVSLHGSTTPDTNPGEDTPAVEDEVSETDKVEDETEHSDAAPPDVIEDTPEPVAVEGDEEAVPEETYQAPAPALPSFLTRPETEEPQSETQAEPDHGGPEVESEPESEEETDTAPGTSEDISAEDEPPAPPVPLNPDIPDDPPDGADAETGILTALSRLDGAQSPELITQLRELADQLGYGSPASNS